MTTATLITTKPKSMFSITHSTDEKPRSQSLINALIRLIRVERFYGNHTYPHEDQNLELVKLVASKQFYLDAPEVDCCLPWLRTQAVHQGCVFEIRSDDWFIARNRNWKMAIPAQPFYSHDAFISDLILVKSNNRPEYKQDSSQMDLVRKHIIMTIYTYRCAMHPEAVDYLADLWLTIFGFRGKQQLADYVIGLAAGPLQKALGSLWIMCWFELSSDTILKTFDLEYLRNTEFTFNDLFTEEDDLETLLTPWMDATDK